MKYVSINERVEDIKGNDEEINKLVEEYKPFIASCTEKFTGRYMTYGESDELSIALMAFVESIKSFDLSKGNFLSFAQGVIRRRLIDFYRKEKKYANVISLNEYFFEENGEEMDLSTGKAIEKYNIDELSEYRRLEIEELRKELLKWGITFNDLVRASPKHSSTCETCRNIINYIISKPEMIEFIKSKKYIPTAEIENTLKISRKKIERLRKYIIATIIVITGDYHYIREYVRDYIPKQIQ